MCATVCCGFLIFAMRCSYVSVILGVVILSVHPSVTRVLCDSSKEPAGNTGYFCTT